MRGLETRLSKYLTDKSHKIYKIKLIYIKEINRIRGNYLNTKI